ncbi:MAG: hypothetical protein ABIK28_00215, partial [Planctomycetota bacterium]
MQFNEQRDEPWIFKTPAILPRKAAALRVFLNSCFEPLAGRRGIMLSLLALLPIVLMLLGRIFGVDRGGGHLFFVTTIVPFYHYINMVFFVFLGCSALGDGIEDKTIIYELICPISRGTLFLGKYLCYLASSLIILLPMLGIAYFTCMVRFGWDAIIRDLPLLFSVVLMTGVSAMLYGSAFVLLSFLIKRSVLVAIVLSLGVDGFLANVPLKISNLSPQIHIRNLIGFLS